MLNRLGSVHLLVPCVRQKYRPVSKAYPQK
jgi:hypothetical protein